MPDPRLNDAEMMYRTYPDHFYLPPEAERRGLRVGQFAKVSFQNLEWDGAGDGNARGERMWLKVVSRNEDGSAYVGTLANNPVVVPFKHGDRISFSPRHVYETRV